MPQLCKVPGPGQYKDQFNTKMTIGYSIREKTHDFIEDKLTYKKNPGPGEYQDINLEPESGRFKISKYSDTKFAKINSKPPRFPEAKDSPGPLSYLEGDSMSSRGKYVLSLLPGPGSYDKNS